MGAVVYIVDYLTGRNTAEMFLNRSNHKVKVVFEELQVFL